MTTARTGALAACAAALLAGSAIGRATAAEPPLEDVAVTVEGRGLRAATGFVVADGRVITVAHAVGDGAIAVRGQDGAAQSATVARRDDELDLALLSVPGLEQVAAPPALAGPRLVVRRDGANVAVPVDVRRRIDARVRDAATGAVVRRPALELDASVRAGDSGAPLIDARGRLAGIVFARSSEHERVAYAVDAAALSALLR